jgi:hypothetical protein
MAAYLVGIRSNSASAASSALSISGPVRRLLDLVDQRPLRLRIRHVVTERSQQCWSGISRHRPCAAPADVLGQHPPLMAGASRAVTWAWRNSAYDTYAGPLDLTAAVISASGCHQLLRQRGGVGRSDTACSLSLASMERIRSRSRSSSADFSTSSRNFPSRAAHCAGVGNLAVLSCLKGRRSFTLIRSMVRTSVPWWRNALTETVTRITHAAIAARILRRVIRLDQSA